jgi:cell division protein FtsN
VNRPAARFTGSVYRVRLGPFDNKAEADALQGKLQAAGLEGQLVRVQKP